MSGLLSFSDFDPLSLRDTPGDSTTGEVLGAVASQALHDNSAVAYFRGQQRFNEAGPGPDAANYWQNYRDPAGRNQGSDADAMAAERGDRPNVPLVDAKTATEQAKAAGVSDLSFDAPMAQTSVDSLISDHKAASDRQTLIDRRASGILTGAVSRFGVQAALGLADPLNLAAMLFPAVPEAMVAEKFAQFGVEGLAGRVAARAVSGGANGAVGMAALEPLQYLKDQSDHNEWTWGGAMRDVALGAALGAGAHVTIGGLFGRGADTAEAAHKAATVQVASGKPVDVADLVRGAEATKAADVLSRPDPFAPARAEFFPEGEPPPLTEGEPSLAEPVKGEDLRAEADQAGRDMAARAMNPSPDPVIEQADRANHTTVERAPAVEGVAEDDLAAATKEFQTAHATIQGEIAAERLPDPRASGVSLKVTSKAGNLHKMDINGPDGKIGEASIYYDAEGKDIQVDSVVANVDEPIGDGPIGSGANALGPRSLVALRKQLLEMFPEAEKFSGIRVSGAGPVRDLEVPIRRSADDLRAEVAVSPEIEAYNKAIEAADAHAAESKSIFQAAASCFAARGV